MLKTIGSASIAMLIAAIGGGLFFALGLPLPWTLGAMTAAGIAAIAGVPWVIPGPMRDVARPVLGVLAGSAFTPAIVDHMIDWWPVLIFITIYSGIIASLGYLFFSRFCKMDRPTSFFAAMPGGLAEVSMLGASLGGEMRTIVLLHAVRIVVIVFCVPFILSVLMGYDLGGVAASGAAANGISALDVLVLAACATGGYLLGQFLPIPGGSMVAAMLLSAVAHGMGVTLAGPPIWLIAAVQLVIGSIAGARFKGVTRRDLQVTVVYGFMWAAVLILATCFAAFVGSGMLQRPFEGLLLALAPGGMAEMTIMTYAIGIEVAFVASCQVYRIFLILSLSAFIYRMFGLVAPRKSAKDDEG